MRNFTIAISEKAIDDLKLRLSQTRWPDQIQNSGWDYGTDISYLKELCAYWEDEFDWRKQEERLNKLDHFLAEIDGQNIHFIHIKGKGKKSSPLLLIHGWPDSFLRFEKVIPLLTDADPDGFSFDLVIPSIPGYGFSDKPKEQGTNPEKIAGLFAKLMTEQLGYANFFVHGGDWGSTITEKLAQFHNQSVRAIHLTDIPYIHLFSIDSSDLTKEEKEYLEAGQKWQMEHGAYAMIQSTQPQTLAYGLTDSPAGLAAWIVEKFQRWSDNDGNLEKQFTKDELLTNISLYWFTETAASSIRLYYETSHTPSEVSKEKLATPTGASIFPKDLILAPRAFGERIFNLKSWNVMPRGGHFAAMEEPDLLASELRNFFKPLE